MLSSDSQATDLCGHPKLWGEAGLLSGWGHSGARQGWSWGLRVKFPSHQGL